MIALFLTALNILGLKESTRFPSFCKLILDVGNFLNYVSTWLNLLAQLNKK